MGLPKTIYCVAMSRSGGTAQYNLVRALIERAGLGRGMGFGVNYRPGSGVGVIKREQALPQAVRMVRNGNALAVGMYRDPRDVYASLIEFRQRQTALTKKVICPWEDLELALEWWVTWEPLCAYVAKYEDVMAEENGWAQMVDDLALLLGIQLAGNEAQSIADSWSIEANQQRIRDMQKWIEPADHLLTKVHISHRQGMVGRWIYDLVPEQMQAVERLAGDWMEAHGYSLLDS